MVFLIGCTVGRLNHCRSWAKVAEAELAGAHELAATAHYKVQPYALLAVALLRVLPMLGWLRAVPVPAQSAVRFFSG